LVFRTLYKRTFFFPWHFRPFFYNLKYIQIRYVMHTNFYLKSRRSDIVTFILFSCFNDKSVSKQIKDFIKFHTKRCYPSILREISSLMRHHDFPLESLSCFASTKNRYLVTERTSVARFFATKNNLHLITTSES